MKLLFVSALLTITIPGSSQTTDTTRHNVVRLGKVVGKHLSWKKGGNDHYYYFEFNDRGRGPSVTSHNRTDSKGNIILQEITGIDYFKTKGLTNDFNRDALEKSLKLASEIFV